MTADRLGDADAGSLHGLSESAALFDVLRKSADIDVTRAVERLVRNEPDHKLCRINVLDFASHFGLDEECVIATFLHGARIGIFELSWNVLCPGCGGVLAANASLKTVRREIYECELCAAGHKVTLDEIIEVTFTVAARVRKIAAHNPETLPIWEYYRQISLSSAVDLPYNFERVMEEAILDWVELPPGGTAMLSLPIPAARVVVFEPVTHSAEFLKVQGEETRQRQNMTVVYNIVRAPTGTVNLRPGPLRLSLENRTNARLLPAVWVTGAAVHRLLSKRRSFLTAKRLLSNQTFRDFYRAETLDIDQRLSITSLTFLFTDLRGSTALYERVGDLAAYDLVREHFQVLRQTVSSQGGAVVKTIGDAVLATFPTPDRAIAAALNMRASLRKLNKERQKDDLILKIGIHEGPCLAVTLNDQQDYFGQTVNVAARVQRLAVAGSILATRQVIENSRTSTRLKRSHLTPEARSAVLPGLTGEIVIYEIP